MNAFESDDDDDLDTGLGNSQSSEKKYWNVNDYVLFLIDCNESMRVAGDNGVSPVISALSASKAMIENKIISSEKDMGINVIIDLQQPDANSILTLDRIIREPNFFESNYGSIQNDNGNCIKYSDLFWAVATTFSNARIPKQGSSKRIFLITNEDDPNSISKKLQNASKTRLMDLLQSGVRLELFNIDRSEESPFNLELFYKQLLMDDGESAFDPNDRLDELRNRIRKKETKKRPLMKLPFVLGPDFEMGVKLYMTFSEARKGNYVLADRDNREVRTVTEHICKDTGASLMPMDLKYYFEYGGEKAIFSKEELSRLKKFGDVGLTLLGFKPLDRLKIYHNIAHSYFLYPDEASVSGSTSLFADLLERMHVKGKIAICRYIARSYSPPRLVALIPQVEMVENGVQVKPPGFNMILLPFADDLREFNKPETLPKVSESQVSKAIEIMEELFIDAYHPEKYENPVIQKHYELLQAYALDREIQFADSTMPNANEIDSKIQVLAAEFKSMTGLSNSGVEKTVGSKRKAEDEDAIKIAYEKGDLKAFKVPELKQFLSDRKITPKRLKAEIIDQITAFFTTSQ